MDYAIQSVFLQVTWMFKSFSADDASDPAKVKAITEQRNKALGLFQDIVLRERSNALGFAKQQVSSLVFRKRGTTRTLDGAS